MCPTIALVEVQKVETQLYTRLSTVRLHPQSVVSMNFDLLTWIVKRSSNGPKWMYVSIIKSGELFTNLFTASDFVVKGQNFKVTVLAKAPEVSVP